MVYVIVYLTGIIIDLAVIAYLNERKGYMFYPIGALASWILLFAFLFLAIDAVLEIICDYFRFLFQEKTELQKNEDIKKELTMAKICTDRKQSKRLEDLGIDPKSADMYWDELSGRACVGQPYRQFHHPAWSLPKLLEMLPHAIQDFHPYKAWGLNMSLRCGSLQYVTDNFDDVKETKIFWDVNGTEIIDTVVEMAVWLAKNGYLWKNGEFRNIKEYKEE